MSSPSSSTRPQQPVQAAAPARSSVNPLTLLIAAVSSAAAAYITSKIWQSGTLIATAMTPVIVALVREALEKPVDRVTTLGAQIAPTRTRASASSPTSSTGLGDPTVVQSPDPDPTHGPMTVHRTGGRLSRRWVRVGIVTGLLAFVIAAVVYTVPELIAGQSAGNGDRATSIFGGSSRDRGSRTPSTTTTSTDETETTQTTDTTESTPEEEGAPTVTEEAEPTVTVTTPAPAATTPQATVPQATTPAPDASGTATTPDESGGAAVP
jgi:hypothetical protein